VVRMVIDGNPSGRQAISPTLHNTCYRTLPKGGIPQTAQGYTRDFPFNLRYRLPSGRAAIYSRVQGVNQSQEGRRRSGGSSS
jgi:hypothetical protein